jgi:Sulfotransferase family
MTTGTNATSTFDPEALLGEARDATGLSNFGDPSFREPFEIYVGSLDTEAKLSSAGRVGQRARVVELLKTRLLLEEWIRRHPEIEHEKLGAPLVIIGLPRTGTTMLYRMLAATEGFASPLYYEVQQPPPPLDWNLDPETDPRIAAAEAVIQAMMETNPEIASIYPFETRAPEEDIFLLDSSFITTGLPAATRVPSYERWFSTADKVPAYRHLHRSLQLLQWQRRKADPEFGTPRWLLKTPDHLHAPDALLEVFPDAEFIQTHRDPSKTIPSISSFIRALHVLLSDEVDPIGIGACWCSFFETGTKLTMQVRDRHPDRFHDVWYEDTVSAPDRVAEGIFRFIGRTFDDVARAEMARWREANKREARPAHDYTLEEFGFTESGIDAAFAEYRERFIDGRAAVES